MNFNSFFQNFSRFNQFNQFKQRPSSLQSLKSFFFTKALPNRLALVLLSVWILYYLTLAYMYMFAVPLKLGKTNEGFDFFVKYIAFNNNLEIVLSNPWQFVISPFFHISFWHLSFNLFILSVFSKLFYEFWNNLLFVSVLAFGIVSSYLFFLFGSEIFPLENLAASEFIFGFNPAMYALMAFMMVFLYDYQFVFYMIIKFKLRYIVLFFVVWDMFLLSKAQPILIASYFAAALSGVIFGLLVKYLSKIKSFKKPKFKVTYSSTDNKEKHKRPETDEMFMKRKKERQDKLDKILDKVSKSGYSTLTKEEKDFLFVQSRKD